MGVGVEVEVEVGGAFHDAAPRITRDSMHVPFHLNILSPSHTLCPIRSYRPIDEMCLACVPAVPLLALLIVGLFSASHFVMPGCHSRSVVARGMLIILLKHWPHHDTARSNQQVRCRLIT